MTVKLASLLTTAALALSVGLVGCSSSEPEAGTPATSAPAASAPASSEAPSQAASPTEAAPSETASTEESSSDSASKPAKGDIVTGLASFYEKTQGLSADKAKKFATCMVDELYDKASAATLKAMMDGDPSKITQSDAGKIAGAGNTCQSALK